MNVCANTERRLFRDVASNVLIALGCPPWLTNKSWFSTEDYSLPKCEPLIKSAPKVPFAIWCRVTLRIYLRAGEWVLKGAGYLFGKQMANHLQFLARAHQLVMEGRKYHFDKKVGHCVECPQLLLSDVEMWRLFLKVEASAQEEKPPDAPCFPFPTACHQSEGSAPEEVVVEVIPKEAGRVWLGGQSSTRETCSLIPCISFFRSFRVPVKVPTMNSTEPRTWCWGDGWSLER